MPGLKRYDDLLVAKTETRILFLYSESGDGGVRSSLPVTNSASERRFAR